MSLVWILLTLLPILGGAERFNCKGRILGGYYADAKSGCKAFHVCVRVAGGGIRDFRFFCPPGTLFHQEAQTCTDWGDDDPLACPTDIYDGFDTRKLPPSGNREEEPEFGLQRAETGDRRLSQNNAASNGPVSDLRAAHSSDFFSGQRDRGRDDPVPQSPPAPPAQPAHPAPSAQRQTYRRPTTQRTVPTTQYTTPSPPPPPQPSNPPSYEVSKRKVIRKRPIYSSTVQPTTFPPNTPPQKTYSDPPQHFNRRPKLDHNQNRQTFSTPQVPPQYKEYKDEYVEVSRVTPKQNRFYPSNVPSTTFPSSTSAPQYNKKEGLIELYNYDAQSTPGLSQQNDNRPLKVKNSFNVQDVPREKQRPKNYNLNVRDNYPTTTDYSATTRGAPNTTPVYKNYNSVSYEPEKKNFIPYSKQNYHNNPTTTTAPSTTIYTTSRPDPPPNLNTIAYNTNIAFQTHSTNYDSDEDDGQYHPPHGEDDGQYKPELYDSELLSGAHSLNIAASGNRLPEERKQYAKTKPLQKHVAQTAAPRPFRPAPTPTLPPTTRAPEPTTTYVPQTVSTQRTFDYYQTYTTTSGPGDYLGLAQNGPVAKEAPARPTTTIAPKVPETRPTRPPSRAPPATSPPAPVPKPTTRPPHFANPPNKKEDNSYDYAYYDSDPGFSEYDHIEEFGKTKTRA